MGRLVRVIGLLFAAVSGVTAVLGVMASIPRDAALANIGTYLEVLPAWFGGSVFLWGCVSAFVVGLVLMYWGAHKNDEDIERLRLQVELAKQHRLQHKQNLGHVKAAEARQVALETLTALRERGVVMRNKLPTFMTDARLQAWIESTRTWMSEVSAALGQVNNADGQWFLTLDTVPPARVPMPNIRLGGQDQRATFESHFRQHDYRLARLDGLLQKYGVGANPR